MRSKLNSLVAVAVLSGALVAGCGSSSSSSSTSSAAPAGTSSSASSTAGSSGGAGIASSPTVQAAVSACKSTVNAAPTLTADEKTKLISLCDKAASGDAAGVKKVAKQVCMDVAQSLPTAVQAQAEAACVKL